MQIIKQASSLHSTVYRPDIDGIRAIAVLLVVFCHAFPHVFRGGFIGVDVFFVISGYLITKILIGDLSKERFSIKQFYVRRVKRIFPALIVTLGFILIAGWFLLIRSEFHTLGKHIVASSLFSENLLLWSESGYFDVSSELKPTLHLWSLAIEEQFYIFFPIILFLAHKFKLKYYYPILILAAISFAFNIYDIRHDPTAAYYSPIGRSWELMIGALLAYIHANETNILGSYKNVQSFAGIALIAIGAVITTPDKDFPGFLALLPTLGTFLLISAGQNAFVNRFILSRPIVIWVGMISYPLYLWHWPFISFTHIVFGDLTFLKAMICIIASIVAADLTFRIIEKPFRVKGSAKKRVILLIGLLSLIVLLAGLVSFKKINSRLSNVEIPIANAWDFWRGRTKNFDKNANGVYNLESTRESLSLFIGDSHVAQYSERLNRKILSDKNRNGAILAIGGACIPIEGFKTDDIRREGCWPLRDQAYEMAINNPKVKTVVIGGAWMVYFLMKQDYFTEIEGKRVYTNTSDGRQLALHQLGLSIENLRSLGKNVVVILDNPYSTQLLLSPKTRFFSGIAANQKILIDKSQLAVNDDIKNMAIKAGARVIDPFEHVCTNRNSCYSTNNQAIPMYKDPGHFSTEWVIRYASFIDDTLNE